MNFCWISNASAPIMMIMAMTLKKSLLKSKPAVAHMAKKHPRHVAARKPFDREADAARCQKIGESIDVKAVLDLQKRNGELIRQYWESDGS